MSIELLIDNNASSKKLVMDAVQLSFQQSILNYLKVHIYTVTAT